MFYRNIEVIALLRLHIRITNNHISHVSHVIVHIHLLERRGTESACIVGTEGNAIQLIHSCQSGCECLCIRSREIVVSHASHHVYASVWVEIELGKGINIVLLVRSVVKKLICGEIVVQKVGTKCQDMLTKRVIVYGMSHMLSVAIVVVVSTFTFWSEIRLVILVIGIRHLYITSVLPVVYSFQSTTIGIEMIVVGVTLTLTVEISATRNELEKVGCRECYSLLHVV